MERHKMYENYQLVPTAKNSYNRSSTPVPMFSELNGTPTMSGTNALMEARKTVSATPQSKSRPAGAFDFTQN